MTIHSLSTPKDFSQGNFEGHFEAAACNLCGSTDQQPVFSGHDRLTGLPGRFQIVQCQNCGAFRQNPYLVWEYLKDYYPDEAYSAYASINKADAKNWQLWINRHGVRKKLHAIEQVQKGGRLLDIGCGAGAFLAEARRKGHWQPEGIEPNKFAADYVQKELGIPVHVGAFPDVSLPSQSYDVITMWNVLEHLYQPTESMYQVNTLLKTGGWVVFSLPNAESIEARIAKQYWSGWDLPRHLYVFSKTNIHQLLEKNGFIVRDTRCISTSYAALGYTLRFWSQDNSRQFPAAARKLTQIYHTAPIRLMMTLPLWLLDRLRLSSMITVFAQKDITHG